MPRRRTLGRMLAGIVGGISGGIQTLASNELIRRRQLDLRDQIGDQSTLASMRDFIGQIDPKMVQEMGPDRVRSMVEARRRTLPGRCVHT
jgi:hypothetical protein